MPSGTGKDPKGSQSLLYVNKAILRAYHLSSMLSDKKTGHSGSQ